MGCSPVVSSGIQSHKCSNNARLSSPLFLSPPRPMDSFLIHYWLPEQKPAIVKTKIFPPQLRKSSKRRSFLFDSIECSVQLWRIFSLETTISLTLDKLSESDWTLCKTSIRIPTGSNRYQRADRSERNDWNSQSTCTSAGCTRIENKCVRKTLDSIYSRFPFRIFGNGSPTGNVR